MSFSKAKLLRFNDVSNTTPSPADYTVLNSSHITGAALSKSERFAELASPASSEGSVNSSCTHTLPVFRTPNPPPKRKTKATNSFKPLGLFQSEEALNELKDKIVECNNKDQYINELMDQVEEMKHQLNNCNTELEHYSVENTRLTETLSKLNFDKEVLVTDQQKHLCDINEKIISMYNAQNLNNDVNTNLKSANELKTLENLGVLSDLLESYETINSHNFVKLKEKDQQIEELEEKLIDLQKQHTKEVADLQLAHDAEIDSIWLEQADVAKQLELKSKLFTEERMNALENDHKIQMQKFLTETEDKIQQLTGNFNEASALAEIQFEEKHRSMESGWALKLQDYKRESDAILKECQAIAEYNIIQTEIEKNQAVYELAELKNKSKQLEEDNETLKRDFDCLTDQHNKLSDVLVEANALKNQLQDEVHGHMLTIDELNKDKHRFQISVTKTHQLIDTLKNRLMDSDRGVEQLKTELEGSEASKLESEQKCNDLEDELCTVLRLFDNVNKEIKAAREDSRQKVLQVEQNLLLKVEFFKTEGESKIATLNEELTETKAKLDDALKHLEEQHLLNVRAQVVIENSLKEIDNLKACTSCLENEKKASEFEQKLQEVEQENANLHAKITAQESLIGPFRELLSEYEAVMNQKSHAEQEAKDIGFKYAQLLGHQNQKQKIKHLLDLKHRNNELSENITGLEAKIRQQARTIEKLKKDLAATPKIIKKKQISDKENIPEKNLDRTFNV